MEIEVNNVKITLTKEQLAQICEASKEAEIEYPIFKQSANTGYIVKFISNRQGIVVWQSRRSPYTVGYRSDGWTSHSCTTSWKDVPYDKKRDLWHGQPIYAWDTSVTHIRGIRFYDVTRDGIFSYDGRSTGFKFDNYQAIPASAYDTWMLKAFETLDR